jgi:hypothetical protein
MPHVDTELHRGRRGKTLTAQTAALSKSKSLVRHWFDIGSTLVRHWFDIGSTLVRHWFDIGSTLVRPRRPVLVVAAAATAAVVR